MRSIFICVALLLVATVQATDFVVTRQAAPAVFRQDETDSTEPPMMGDIIEISRNNLLFQCVIEAATPGPDGTYTRELKMGKVLMVANANLLLRCAVQGLGGLNITGPAGAGGSEYNTYVVAMSK